jgi:hypothetical protein
MSRGAHHMCEVPLFQVSRLDSRSLVSQWVVFPLRARFRRLKSE